MHETKDEYESIVRLKVQALERQIGHGVKHGHSGFCPRCGIPGTFDTDGIGFNSLFDNAIYYSTVFNEWRCRICDFRRCS